MFLTFFLEDYQTPKSVLQTESVLQLENVFWRNSAEQPQNRGTSVLFLAPMLTFLLEMVFPHS
jgi:hypothetical protein